MISIHAPAKGATLLKCSSRSDGRDFNPRSREGSDHDKGRCEGNGDDFNPRSREGSDPATPPSWKIQRDFNPRSREGSDIGSMGACKQGYQISIHAPAKGATKKFQIHVDKNQFQSTLPRRERRCLIHLLDSKIIFQSTLPRRERHIRGVIMARKAEFQSTLPRRERHPYINDINTLKKISIHAPAKGATWKNFFLRLL